MNLSERDTNCRFLAGPGTLTKCSSPFGTFLRDHGIELSGSTSLEAMVARGWVTPVLRVPLPQRAMEAWRNYPQISPIEVENCPEDQEWAISLYITAMTGPTPFRKDPWWITQLDNLDDELTQAARQHAIAPDRADLLPPAFTHSNGNREVRPWIDYFAYWQVFQIHDYGRAMTGTYVRTDEPLDRDREKARRQEAIERIHTRLSNKWSPRNAAFEWISRMRTVMGASVSPERSSGETDAALKSVAAGLHLSVDQMKQDARQTLLRMWSEASDAERRGEPWPPKLVHLLRQDIQYAVEFIAAVSEMEVDPLDPFWSNKARHDGNADLIKALPREFDLARQEFPWYVEPYFQKHAKEIPQLLHLDKAGLATMLELHWRDNRALQRIVLSLHRLHQELHGEQLTAQSDLIRQTERIEQFNLTAMHAERVLSHEHRRRSGGKSFPEVRKTAKDSLNFVLCRWKLSGKVLAKSHEVVQTLMDERAQLHQLDPEKGLPLVGMSEAATGDSTVDRLIAAFVNLVIIRNYAAHHDSMDWELVYVVHDGQQPHPGGLALESLLLAVISVLSVTDQPRKPKTVTV